MSDNSLDVLTVGNAIVDVIVYVGDIFLSTYALQKGTMRLVQIEEANYLYKHVEPTMECSGGSAANTAVGIALLGGRTAFIGKVADDHLGRVFIHDLNTSGVCFKTKPVSQKGLKTACCLVLVTPDAQRTMNTYLGACTNLEPDDIDPFLVSNARITYLEGYQWDALDAAKAAMYKAAELAKSQGGRVAFSLSDPLCVDRHRSEFRDLIDRYISILFANEMEIMSLYQVHTLSEAIQIAQKHCGLAVITRGENGAVIIEDDIIHMIQAEPVTHVLDTTGAGDLFASGFLYGLTRNMPLTLCGRLGSLCSAEIISHLGARPKQTLAGLIKKLF